MVEGPMYLRRRERKPLFHETENEGLEEADERKATMGRHPRKLPARMDLKVLRVVRKDHQQKVMGGPAMLPKQKYQEPMSSEAYHHINIMGPVTPITKQAVLEAQPRITTKNPRGQGQHKATDVSEACRQHDGLLIGLKI